MLKTHIFIFENSFKCEILYRSSLKMEPTVKRIILIESIGYITGTWPSLLYFYFTSYSTQSTVLRPVKLLSQVSL